jgi:hypothetical protein
MKRFAASFVPINKTDEQGRAPDMGVKLVQLFQRLGNKS